MSRTQRLIFELSVPGRTAVTLPAPEVPTPSLEAMFPSSALRAKAPGLPEVSEVDVVRHFVNLSQLNHSVDNGFYPLGSCTMKYNPKVNEDAARLPGFARIHPDQPADTVQGALEIMYKLERYLCEIAGMSRFTLQPAAGAHGELTGLLLIKAYHDSRADFGRKVVLVPDSAHGTNPASAAGVGMTILEVKSDSRGNVDIEDLKDKIGPEVAAMMLTNPNTLGLFDEHVTEIAEIVHGCGALLYYDGANLNAIMGRTRPGDLGFDVVHLNVHKTFSTPHGGGGPGAGPVGVKPILEPFLPTPLVALDPETGMYVWDDDRPQSIGRVHSFHGNFGVLVKTFAYIRSMGPDGLRKASEHAVLNANYIMRRLKPYYDVAFDRTCMHECVLTAKKYKSEHGVATLDIAKRLLDFGFHAPTIYFPLIVPEALMIEPTETESRETLDGFINAMIQISEEAKAEPEKVKSAPHTTPVSRLDDTLAARKPVLRHTKSESD